MESAMDRNRALGSYRFFAVGDEAIVLWESGADCWDDDEALATGLKLSASGVKIEVWDVARFVGQCDFHH